MSPSADDAGSLGVLGDAALAVMQVLGGPGAGLLVAIENLFPPIPSEIVLPLAGFAAGRGTMTLAEAILWTTAGSVAGALVVYGVAVRLGADRTRALIGRIPLLSVADFDRSAAWFDRHGRRAVFLARLLPFFRSFISLPAGVTRMPLWAFVTLTLLGSGLWNTVFIVAGYLLGANWRLVERSAGVVQWVVLAAVALVVVVFLVRRLRRMRSDRRADGAPGSGAGH